MKTKAVCSSKTISVKLRGAVDCHAYRLLALELIKHLLYMRNQIPSLYEDLEWQVQQLLYDEQLRKQAANAARTEAEGNANQLFSARLHKTKRRPQTSQKRLCKFFQATDSIMSALGPECFSSQRPVQVVLAFGSTASRPLELYSLTLLPADKDGEATEHAVVEDLVRRTVRSLVVNTQDMPDGKAASGPTKLFILLYGQYEVAPPGFVYKRGFTIRMRKGLQVHLKLTEASCHIEDASDIQPAFLTAGEQDSEMQWFQCQIVLKGLRAPGNGEIDRSG